MARLTERFYWRIILKMLDVKLINSLACEHGTPLYIFDKAVLRRRVDKIREILGSEITLCFAMKANPFLVDCFKELNTRFEVCSPGEFAICEREHVNMHDIVLSGVNKEKADIEHVMDDCGGVGIYTVESVEQFNLLRQCADERGTVIDVLLRVTSGNQFGLDESDLERIVKNRDEYKSVNIRGIQCYSGTQKKKIQVISEELKWLDDICNRLYEKYGFKTEELEYGPGLPYNYFGTESYDNNFDFLKELSEELNPLKERYSITLEMGRFLVSECGMYVTSVADIKVNRNQNYVIVDGGINHINYYGQTMAMKVPAYSYVKHDGTVIKDTDKYSVLTGGDHERWTVCGSLCTVADVVVKNLPIGTPDMRDKIIFYNIGAYSVTEGIYLFLSRKMPKIIAIDYDITNEKMSDVKDIKVETYREIVQTDRINSRIDIF